MNKQTYKTKNGGYIALISTIIISAILIGLTAMVSQSSFFSRFDSLNGEYKRISKGMAESCVNLALLEIAKSPNMDSVTNTSGGSVDCKYSIDNSLPYDSEHKKIVNIIGTANYNGAFSKIEANFTVYDPQYSPPSKIVVRVYSYGTGAKAAEDFGPFKVNGTEVQLGQATVFNSGIYNITEVLDSDYYTSYSGDCDSDGKLTLGVNDYQTCNIINTLKPQTASLTVVIANDGYLPTSLNFDGDLYSPQTNQKITISRSQLNPDGSDKIFSIKLSSIDLDQYNVSDWAGTDCSRVYNDGQVLLGKGDNKVCAISLSKKTALPKAALTIVTRVINSSGGTAKAADFTVNVSAINSSKQNEVVTDDSKTTTYYIDPGAFNVTENDLGNYKKDLLNSEYPYSCQGTADIGQSYLCLITNTDITTTFTLTTSVNVTQAYNVTPAPNFTLALDSDDGHHYSITSGVAKSNLPPATYTVSITGTGNYSVSPWGSSPDCSPTGVVAWTPGDKHYKNCTINLVENPPPFHDIDTLMMLDRTGSMFQNSNWISGERVAAKSFLNLFTEIASPRPQVGVGVFGNDSGNSAKIAGTLTNNYGNESVTPTSAGPNTAGRTCSGNGCQNQWTTPDNGRNIDSTYATDSTNGHQQDYYNYGFNIPVGATITGIEVKTDGFVSGSSSTPTGTLFPNGQGTYTAWTNGESTIDETDVNPSCSSGDYISTGTANNRESVLINLSSIPNNATITSVDVTAFDRGDTNSGGTYKTFTRLNGTVIDAGANLAASGTSGCNSKTQTIDVTDTVKNAGTILEVGVIKINSNNNTVRVGAIRAVVRYTTGGSGGTTGALSVSLSANGGNNWTTTKSVTLTDTETLFTPIGNSSTDTWGRTWTSDELNNNFRVRVRNDSTTGMGVSLNYTTVKVYYTSTVATGLYLAINTNLANNINSYTDLSAAVSVANSELNSARHISGNKKYIIMLSDGEPTLPCNGRGCTTAQNQESALVAADVTKKGPDGIANNIDDTIIFTIHFGDVAGRDFLAKLATGTVANGTHQPGSNNDKATIDAENNDGDHFFIVSATTDPTQAMIDIFGKIGQQIIDAEAPPTATTGILNVITHVITNKNNHIKKIASDFQITVSGSNPTQTFSGSEAPGRTIILNPGTYNVTESADINYVKTIDPACSGTITAGQEVTCIIIDDDAAPSDILPLPEPPPPPPSVTLKQTLVVVTQVNNASGTASKNPSNFTISVSNPYLHSFSDDGTGTILDDLNKGAYTVVPEQDIDGKYTVARSPECVGNIDEGQTKTCVVIYTANPPPPPPIDMQQNIDINSWHEIPIAN